MNVFLFNPDNDLALANNNPNYRSPASARRMGQELTPLMGWLAEDGDYLLFPERTAWSPPALSPRLNACFLPELTEEFEKDRKRLANLNYLRERPHSYAEDNFLHPEEKNRVAGQNPKDRGNYSKRFRNAVTTALYGQELLMPDRIVPWGWNPGLIRLLTNAGVDPALLPSPDKMGAVRQVSHRSLAVRVLDLIREEASEEVKPTLCGRSSEVRSENDLKELIERSRTRLLLKAPLSGSGRGLIRADGAYVHPVSGWCRSTLRSQGSVIVEPYYDKACDFAMEFYMDEMGDVAFKGYSLFETNAHGSYTCNLLMTDRQIVSRICGYGFSEHQLLEVRRLLEHTLSVVAGRRYTGYLGVDMMVCRDEERYRLHPCVEVNARFTMGVFSRLFYDRYVREDATGIFHIRYSKSPAVLWDESIRCRKDYPLVTRDHKIVSGYLPLTPLDVNSCFVAEIYIKS